MYDLCTNRAKKHVRKKHGHTPRAHTRLVSWRPALAQGESYKEAVAPVTLGSCQSRPHCMRDGPKHPLKLFKQFMPQTLQKTAWKRTGTHDCFM